MRHSWAIGCVLALGCGRFGFEEPEPAPEPALAISYPSADVHAVVGVSAIRLEPTIDAGPATFAIAPGLPEGLALDPDTGVVSGTPSKPADGLTYTITATRGADAAAATLRITALPGFVVDAIGDDPDDDAGADAVCFASTSGGCTLRAAFQTANARATKQLILLDARTYLLKETLGGLATDLVIVGQGAGATTIRPISMHPGWGMLYVDTPSRLTLRGATFRDFGPCDGAVALVKSGSLVADAARFENNRSAGAGGVFLVRGGASALLERSTFTGNSSDGGCCGGWGGVIHGEGDGTQILVRKVTATENVAAWGSFSHISEGTTLTLENSTLYRNTSRTAGTLASPGGVYTVLSSTIVHNLNTNATPDSAGLFLYSAPAAYTVANTILAFNRDVSGNELNCHHRTAGTRVTSMGGNVISDTAGNCKAELVGPDDQLGVDPGLAPDGLRDGGGPTSTIGLAPGSPAIDAAGGGAPCPAEDQRGVRRPDAPALCDAGAVEAP